MGQPGRVDPRQRELIPALAKKMISINQVDARIAAKIAGIHAGNWIKENNTRWVERKKAVRFAQGVGVRETEPAVRTLGGGRKGRIVEVARYVLDQQGLDREDGAGTPRFSGRRSDQNHWASKRLREPDATH